MKKISVTIIGGGLAGLAAAYELSKTKKYTVTLLEKNDHLGGRAHTVQVNGVAIDVGGFIIYPWYKTFHRILGELREENKLKKLPLLHIFYDLAGEKRYMHDEEIPLSVKTKSKLAIKLLPAFLNNLEVARPHLERLKDITVTEFIREKLPVISDPFLETYIDMICQGYCYPPSNEFRAAFMLPMMGNNLFSGDVFTSSYFPKGMKVMVDALEKTLIKRGVMIKKNITVKKVKAHTVITESETLHTDAIILAHPLTKDIQFTTFLTITVLCNTTPKIEGSSEWGALFLRPDIHPSPEILSIINLEKLYGKKVKNTLTLNIKLKNKDRPTSSASYAKKVTQALQKFFPEISHSTITSFTVWERTMPISHAPTIQYFRDIQGKDDIYYAGDFLGSPSMETALATGVLAAQDVLAHHHHNL